MPEAQFLSVLQVAANQQKSGTELYFSPCRHMHYLKKRLTKMNIGPIALCFLETVKPHFNHSHLETKKIEMK